MRVWPTGTGGKTGIVSLGTKRFPCALGRSGLALRKREGDGGTPVGVFQIRTIHIRRDRGMWAGFTPYQRPIGANDGWCDAPDDRMYNRLVRRPYPASHEAMWRDDHLYDIVFELGYNDVPPRPGLGSAIFMHLARKRYTPTEGCVALSAQHMREVMRLLRQGDWISIQRTPYG